MSYDPQVLLKLRVEDGYCPLHTLYTGTVGVPTTPYGNNAEALLMPSQKLSHYVDITNYSDATRITNYGGAARDDT